MNPSRRSLLTGIGAFLCAPAIVRASSLMPVKAWDDGLLVKRTERFLRGSHGTIALCPALSVEPTSSWFLVGAAEPIWKGDLISIRGGYAYRANATDIPYGLERCGVALTNSEHCTHLF